MMNLRAGGLLSSGENSVLIARPSYAETAVGWPSSSPASPGARHHRHGLRPSGAGAQFPSPDAVGETPLVASAAGLGHGGAPLPDARGGTLTIPREVLEHRAVLTLPDGTPFSHVVKTYTSEVFAFPERLPPGGTAPR